MVATDSTCQCMWVRNLISSFPLEFYFYSDPPTVQVIGMYSIHRSLFLPEASCKLQDDSVLPRWQVGCWSHCSVFTVACTEVSIAWPDPPIPIHTDDHNLPWPHHSALSHSQGCSTTPTQPATLSTLENPHCLLISPRSMRFFRVSHSESTPYTAFSAPESTFRTRLPWESGSTPPPLRHSWGPMPS